MLRKILHKLHKAKIGTERYKRGESDYSVFSFIYLLLYSFFEPLNHVVSAMSGEDKTIIKTSMEEK